MLCSVTGFAAEPPSTGEILRLTEQLRADRFAQRTSATFELLDIGRPAIPFLIESLAVRDREGQSRALRILEDLASSMDPILEDEVIESLDSVVEKEDHPARRFAAAALDRLRSDRQAQSITTLTRLGAELHRRGNDEFPNWAIRVNARWTGTEDQFRHFVRLGNIDWLSLENSTMDDNALEHIGKLHDLQYLFLGPSQIGGGGLAKLGELENLQFLSLRGLAITDRTFKHLPPMTSLTSLGLDDTNITDAGLDHLANYPNLQTLWLDRTRITHAGLAKLSKNPELAELYLGGVKVSGEGLASLRELPKLRKLFLKGTQLSAEDMPRLGGLAQLETLHIDHTNVADEHLAKLGELPNLQMLWLSKLTGVTDASVDQIAKCKQLKTIYLHGAGISEHGADKLRRLIPNVEVHR